jgi:hypothetical protein
MKLSTIARRLFSLALFTGIVHAATGEVTPLSRSDTAKVEAMLTKVLKGKPTVKSGQKEELEDGWKITCVAEVGSGGEFVLVVTSEKSMTLGSIVSQNPSAPKKG